MQKFVRMVSQFQLKNLGIILLITHASWTCGRETKPQSLIFTLQSAEGSEVSVFVSMATSLLCPLSALSSSTIEDPRASGQMGPSMGLLQKSTFLHGTKLFSASVVHPTRRSIARRCFSSPLAKSLDHIPKHFREENLKDGCESLSPSIQRHQFSLYYCAQFNLIVPCV